ncbi:MAG: TetR/AcrR family transcriptional regulator [Nonlabens sp.]|jgi:DNA-binding XRE family transcriptional regulator|uniref:TetR/AcrR family transcriptional regulator n=1 Tax=Nonlabens sp. TaxID=1888209 RepID=UPI0035A5E2AE
MTKIKEQIIATSLELFLTLGFKSVTMDEIASKLGMSKKTLYTHFKNKSKLVEESSIHLCNHICNGVDHIVDEENENAIEELYTVKKFVMLHLKGNETSPVYQLHKYYPEVHKKITALQFNHMEDCIKKNVTRGIKRGLYRDNIDVDFIARIYYIGIQGIKNLSIFPMQKFPMNELNDQYLEYHLRGIVTSQGRKILNKITNTNHN